MDGVRTLAMECGGDEYHLVSENPWRGVSCLKSKRNYQPPAFEVGENYAPLWQRLKRKGWRKGERKGTHYCPACGRRESMRTVTAYMCDHCGKVVKHKSSARRHKNRPIEHTELSKSKARGGQKR